MSCDRIFVLSPASSGGKRASILMSERATFDLARRVREDAATLGEVFSFLSGLYFRGKLEYAQHFARAACSADGVLVITPHRGLLPADTLITLAELREFGTVPIDLAESRYREPLERDARALAQRIGTECDVVLLGSVATGKYTEVLTDIFGERLRFPADFVGRGDMSRGGLLLRCIDDNTELEYVRVIGAVKHGSRPPKLAKRK
jgi:hypothetical protein